MENAGEPSVPRQMFGPRRPPLTEVLAPSITSYESQLTHW